MKKSNNDSPDKQRISNSSIVKNVKKAILSIGIVGLIGLTADFFGILSFFKSSETEVENQYNVGNLEKLDNSTNYNDVDNSININNYNNQTNYIDKSTYKTQITNEIVRVDTFVQEVENSLERNISKAIKYYNNGSLNLALRILNKYDHIPEELDSVFFYTLKANTFFYLSKFDSSYHYHLLAYNTDKNSEFVDYGKLKGLTYVYGHLRPSSYQLKDVKSIKMSENGTKFIYDVGDRKIEMPNGVILFKEDADNEDFINLLRELKMVKPGFKIGKK